MPGQRSAYGGTITCLLSLIPPSPRRSILRSLTIAVLILKHCGRKRHVAGGRHPAVF